MQHCHGINNVGKQGFEIMNEELWDDAPKFGKCVKYFVDIETSSVAIRKTDGQVIGFLLTSFHQNNFYNPEQWIKLAPKTEIHGAWLAVLHEQTNQGVASALIRQYP